MIRYLLIAVIAYLLGSVSTGMTIAAIMNRNDLRTKGSKNIGATNVQRVLGNLPGILTLIGDGAKGFLACLIGHWILGESGAMVGGLFAVIGHNWPLYYGFKGGKGVACSTGVYLFVNPTVLLFAAIAFLISVLVTGFVSLGSMVALAVTAVLMIVFHLSQPLYWLWALILFAMCVWRHRENIRRLKDGTEHKFSFNRKKS